MEIYNSEEEQVEALNRWWKANGTSVISGIIAGIVIIGGWNLWSTYKQDQATRASAVYEQLLASIQKGENESAEKLAGKLIEQYDSTPYASFAALFQAKIKVQEGDLQAAQLILEQAIARSDNELKEVARVRLIRLLLAMGDYEKGLQLIAEVDQSSAQSFTGNYEELKGDLYSGLQRYGEARTAYQNALREGQRSPLLQFKIDDLTAPEIVITEKS